MTVTNDAVVHAYTNPEPVQALMRAALAAYTEAAARLRELEDLDSALHRTALVRDGVAVSISVTAPTLSKGVDPALTDWEYIYVSRTVSPFDEPTRSANISLIPGTGNRYALRISGPGLRNNGQDLDTSQTREAAIDTAVGWVVHATLAGLHPNA